MFWDQQWCETGMYHVPLALQFIYRHRDEGVENGDGEEGSEISGRVKRVEIAWPPAGR